MPDHTLPKKLTINERLDALTMNLELQARIQRCSDAPLTGAIASLTAKPAELARIIHETAATVQMFAVAN